MEAYLIDWTNLLLRWLHVITAIAWVGSSFYFVFLDNNLIKPKSADLLEKGVDGAMWAVHGGGFYNPQKYMVAPPKIHTDLHWFYWESYSTWLSGFALFTISYLWQADAYLIDPAKWDMSPSLAVALALGLLAGFWLVYDSLCRSLGQGQNGDLKVGLSVALVVIFACWLANAWFSGRAAFLLVGAMLGTAMSANVFFWIIPGQRKVVAAMQSGQRVDPIHGKRGKQRSVHNTYFTLPVLFAMLSNHYSFLYSHKWNWVILALMMFAGAAIRQFFVMRHGYKHGRNRHPWPYAVLGVLVISAVMVALRPAPTVDWTGQLPEQVTLAEIKPVIAERCYACHGAEVQMKGLRFDDDAVIRQQAQSIYQQVSVLKLMPLSNTTGITELERALFARWFEQGAR